jgi:hypothetical protein
MTRRTSSSLRSRVRDSVAYRPGISLLETSIAIFVVAVGLLGVFALVPVAMYQVNEANKANRAWDTGMAAFREIQTRGFLNRANWSDPWAAAGLVEPQPPYNPYPPAGAPGIPPDARVGTSTFVMDPLFLSGVASTPPPGPPLTAAMMINRGPYEFPYQSAEDVSVPATFRMARLTVQQAGGAMPQMIAERIFRGEDDLSYVIPDDPDVRISPAPTTIGQPGFVGDYSWMFMVTPIETEYWMAPALKRRFEVDVVVFYKRPIPTRGNLASQTGLAIPGERTVFADTIPGSGDVTLRYTPGTSAGEYLDVKPNGWILLYGGLNPPQYPGVQNPPPAPPQQQIHQWCRIVAVDDEEESATGQRRVHVAGFDIPSPARLTDMDGDSTNGTTMLAGLFEGVVGVFRKTIEVDR